MLKLKKLQILGFKSFCDRTELRFSGEGVAAIVGPNGCGKSNIADAITWVLGEQSAKSLRGARMEDVIFAGTRERKATGMAEVTMTLIDPQVYEGADVGDEPEIEIRDEMPVDDWDEETVRSEKESDTAAYTEEVRPNTPEEIAAAAALAEAAAPEPQAGPAGLESGATDDAGPAGLESGATAQGATAIEPDAAAQVHAGPQVVLKIRRRKFSRVTQKKGEIVVTRRLFRSGESEYLLNHKLCRLRDIQDIFMGTGLGPESYAIIEQGRIGQILSSKPTDRRAIIEEAAGITKFKTKKRLAEARLEDAKLNLNRVNDIFEEVTRQMNSLKRQAAKAARYARLRDEMREKLRVVLASKFAQLQREKEQLEAELTGITEELHVRTDAVRKMESEQGERTQRGYEIETGLRQIRERLSQIALESDRAAAKSRTNEERCAELLRRSRGGPGRTRRDRRETRDARSRAPAEPRDPANSRKRRLRRTTGVEHASAGGAGHRRDAGEHRARAGAAPRGHHAGRERFGHRPQPHHPGGGKHRFAGARNAATAERDHDGESAVGELWRRARTTYGRVRLGLREGRDAERTGERGSRDVAAESAPPRQNRSAAWTGCVRSSLRSRASARRLR